MRYLEERLSLEPGSLGDAEDLSRADQRRGNEVDLLARYSEAHDSWRSGAFGLALEQATALQHDLAGHNRPDLKWLTTQLLVEITTYLGMYPEAVQRSEELRTLAHQSGSRTLTVKADTALARAARHADQRELAKTAAIEAVDAARGSSVSPETRAEALVSAISARAGQGTQEYEASLVDLFETLENPHERGRAAWALGTTYLLNGDVPEGLAWQEVARTSLSPTADFRDWARFPRAAVDTRLAMGLMEGVEELIAEAEQRLTLLDVADEDAMLVLAKAQFHVLSGSTAQAIELLRDWCQHEDLPPETKAELLMALSRIDDAANPPSDRREQALEAAKLYTLAGHVGRAQAAWKALEEIEIS